MKKKFLYALFLGILTVSLTGCVKFDATMNIKPNKSMNFSTITAIDTSILGDDEIVSSEEKENLEKRGFIISDYEEDSMKGVIVSKKIKNIDAVSSIDDIEYSLSKILEDESSDIHIFKVKKGFLKNIYTAIFTFDISDINLETTSDTKETDWSWINENTSEDFSNALVSSMDLSFKVNLPYSAKRNNATNTNKGNKNLSWNLTTDSVNKIEFEFELYNLLNVGIVVGITVLIIAVLVIIILKNKKNKEKNQSNQPVETLTPISSINEQIEIIEPIFDQPINYNQISMQNENTMNQSVPQSMSNQNIINQQPINSNLDNDNLDNK